MDIGSILLYGAVTVWSGWVAYMIVMRFFPAKGASTHPSEEPKIKETPVATPATSEAAMPQPVIPDYQMKEGFKSFQTGTELTVEDIVKGLSRRG